MEHYGRVSLRVWTTYYLARWRGWRTGREMRTRLARRARVAEAGLRGARAIKKPGRCSANGG
jgi:hypothetical protein